MSGIVTTIGSLKPRTALCRRPALMAWTTWSEEEIAHYVKTKRLAITKFHANSHPRYVVQSAQRILDELADGRKN